MAQAKTGDKVRVHYTGTLEDGSVFDSSEPKSKLHPLDSGCGCRSQGEKSGCGCSSEPADEPLEFVIGAGQLIPKFEAAVIGLEPGQSISVSIPADDAYGQRANEMIAVIERSEIPSDIKPEPGHQMEVLLEDGTPLPVIVTEVSDTTITLDANHPLAGRELNFAIRLVEII
ncbi:MAG: peptidylprolyl isomerase [Desulfuromonadaceae bacterium]|nr:peptidylprolyl isomerase [Desulfuromonadaceae bacterium]